MGKKRGQEPPRREPYRGPWPPPNATTEVKMNAARMGRLLDLLVDVMARQDKEGPPPYNTQEEGRT